jgi:hypothetical protein
MFELMADYVTRNNFIPPIQSGFRPGHSTMAAFVRVSNDIRLYLEMNQPTILVLLEFFKAFDSVCYRQFILKLRQRYGFHSSAVALVSFYLFPQHQRVSCGDDFSSRLSYLATLFFFVHR